MLSESVSNSRGSTPLRPPKTRWRSCVVPRHYRSNVPLHPHDVASAEQVASRVDCDDPLMFGACGYGGEVPHAIAAAGKPSVLFLRHRTEPHYCQHVSTHAINLRRWTDSFQEPNKDVHDVAVDDYDEILWRLRALYGLQNGRGTKMLAVGGVMHYSPDGDKHGARHAREVWGYEIVTYGDYLREVGYALKKARKIVWENLSENTSPLSHG